MGTIFDETDYNHDATTVGNPSVVTGINGLALELDGATQYATIPDTATLNISTCTIITWINTAVLANQAIFANFTTGGNPQAGILCRVGSTGLMQMFIGSNGTQGVATGTTDVADGEWHHVAATYDGNEIIVYVDGLEEARVTFTDGLAYSAECWAAIGAYSADDGATPTNLFTGLIDDVRLYSNVFDYLEVWRDFVGTPATFYQQIAFSYPDVWYRLDESTGTIAVSEFTAPNLRYESDASTAGYSSASSVVDGLGFAKNINGDTARQIYDPATGDGQNVSFAATHYKSDATLTGTRSTFTVSPTVDPLKSLLLVNNNRYGSAGPASQVGGTATNMNTDDVGVGFTLFAARIDTERASAPTEASVQTSASVVEYQGAASGADEFLVRHVESNYVLALGTKSGNITIAGVVNKDKCVAMITGIRTTAATNVDFDQLTAKAYLTSNTNLYVEVGNTDAAYTMYLDIRVVEFTGSNWTVHYGTSGDLNDEGTIALNDQADGTSGAASSVGNWDNAFIIGHYVGDADVNISYAIADTWPIYRPTAGLLNSVDFKFTVDHDAVTEQTMYVAVVEHPNISVTRFTTNDAGIEGEAQVDISSAGISDLANAALIGFSISTGAGTALARGTRNYYFIDNNTAANWCHRSGNEMEHELQVINFDGAANTVGQLDSTNFSIEFAFNAATLTAGRAICGKTSNNYCWAIHLANGDNNVLVMDLYQSDSTQRTITLAPDLASILVSADSTWHWLSVVMDFSGDGFLSCQIDGSVTANQDVSSWSGIWRQDTASALTLGGLTPDDASPWQGEIDEWSFYRRALDPLNRAQNFRQWAFGAVVDHTVQILDADISDNADDGIYTTGSVSVTVTGGEGPFEYSWTSDEPSITPDSPLASATAFVVNGSNEVVSGIITCTVTDLGNGNLERTATINVGVTFTTPIFNVIANPLSVTEVDLDGTWTSVALLGVTLENGVGPYTYSWSTVGGARITVISPTSATTRLTAVGAAEVINETVTVTVTDLGNGFVTDFTTIPIQITFDNVAALDDYVARWPMDAADVTNTQLLDSTGNGYHLDKQIPADRPLVAGVNDYSYRSSLSSGDAAISNDPIFRTTTFTTMGWVNQEDLHNSRIVSCFRNNSSAPYTAWVLSVDGNNRLALAFRSNLGGAITIYSPTDSFNETDTWYHVAVACKGDYAVLYINGIARANTVLSSVLFGFVGDEQFGLGSFQTKPMLLDEWRFHTRYFDPNEIYQIYDDQVTNFTPATPFAVTIDPNQIAQNGSGLLTLTDAYTAVVTGGIGPFTYSWAKPSANVTNLLQIDGVDTDPSVTLSGTQASGQSIDYYRCTVTDTGNFNDIESDDTTTIINWQSTGMQIQISPNGLVAFATAGQTYLSTDIQFNVIGGVGPYNWAWTKTGGDATDTMFPNNDSGTFVTFTADSTKFEGISSAGETSEVFTLTVIDTGDSNTTVSKNFNVVINWGIV